MARAAATRAEKGAAVRELTIACVVRHPVSTAANEERPVREPAGVLADGRGLGEIARVEVENRVILSWRRRFGPCFDGSQGKQRTQVMGFVEMRGERQAQPFLCRQGRK